MIIDTDNRRYNMVSKSFKKVISLVLVLLMTCSNVVFAKGDDYLGHWAAESIQNWVDKGYVKGYKDGSFRPDNHITRAEFIAITNRSFGFDGLADIHYKDVKASHWAYNEFKHAQAAGYIAGFEDGTLRPNDQISRQEVAAIIARLLNLGEAKKSEDFLALTDIAQIPDWSAGAISAMVDNGYMRLRDDSSFAPSAAATRAEVIAALDSGYLTYVKHAYNEAGTYAAGIVDGSVEINAKGVVLEDTVINGNLIIGEDVGNGTVTLTDVVVKGDTVVNGGGMNSVIINNSQINHLIVQKKDGKVRILAKGDTYIDKVDLRSGAKLASEGDANNFGTVIIAENLLSNEPIILMANFAKVETKSGKNEIQVNSKKLAKFVVGQTAKDVKINLAEGATITTLEANAPATIDGKGKIETAIINVDDVKITATVDKTELAEGIKKPTPMVQGDDGASSSSTPSRPVVDKAYHVAGTYGPATGKEVVQNVVVSSSGVTLQNMEVRGSLVLAEGIADGDVHLKNVKVLGDTIIRGGGPNSIHFEDTVLATVIVNKNDGKIRIVAKGNTQIIEVQLESPARLEEENLGENAPGFANVNIGESVQTGSNLAVELVGNFETINSRASQVRIDLPQGTSIREIVLNVAAQVLGLGTIDMATINANGSTISTRPQNVVLNANSVSIRDQAGNVEQVDSSYSNALSSEIQGIELGMTSIQVRMSHFMADITADDFKVTATIDGEAYELQNLRYNVNTRRFTFMPIEAAKLNQGKTLKVTVGPNSDKLTGTVQIGEVALKTGFSGRITDIQRVGIAGITIKFRAGANAKEGDVVATAITDANGYYTVAVEPGEYTGELVGDGILTTYLYATALSDRFNTDQNETAIRATAMDAVKIVLTWGEYPRDEDSHLEGPTSDGERFHVYFADKIYEEDGVRHVDLDWDDTESYGPETTSIYKLVDGTYKFYVHNWSGEAPLVGSGAKVEIYQGSEAKPSKTFEIPSPEESEDGIFWMVFDMVVENKAVVAINAINKIEGIVPHYEINGTTYKERWDNHFNPETPITEENPLTISIPNAEGHKIYYSINDGPQRLYTGPFKMNRNGYIRAYSAVEGIQANHVGESQISIGDWEYEEPKIINFAGEIAITTDAAIALMPPSSIEFELYDGHKDYSDYIAGENSETNQLEFSFDGLFTGAYTLIVKVTVDGKEEEIVKEIILEEDKIWESSGPLITGFEEDILDSAYKLEIKFSQPSEN